MHDVIEVLSHGVAHLHRVFTAQRQALAPPGQRLCKRSTQSFRISRLQIVEPSVHHLLCLDSISTKPLRAASHLRPKHFQRVHSATIRHGMYASSCHLQPVVEPIAASALTARTPIAPWAFSPLRLSSDCRYTSTFCRSTSTPASWKDSFCRAGSSRPRYMTR